MISSEYIHNSLKTFKFGFIHFSPFNYWESTIALHDLRVRSKTTFIIHWFLVQPLGFSRLAAPHKRKFWTCGFELVLDMTIYGHLAFTSLRLGAHRPFLPCHNGSLLPLKKKIKHPEVKNFGYSFKFSLMDGKKKKLFLSGRNKPPVLCTASDQLHQCSLM